MNVYWYNTYSRFWALPVCAAVGRCGRLYVLDDVDIVLPDVEVH